MTEVWADAARATVRASDRSGVPARRSPRTVLWLCGLVGLGAAVRFYRLGVPLLSYDESFTAMTGRLPFRALLGFLRTNDSHPPLDYLLRAPIARLGASEFWLRAPSVVLSIGALALFAWWLRHRGRVAVIATALLAVNTFEVVHGRDARMYAAMEFIGVGAVVVGSAWSDRPRRWHAPAVGVLVFVGLLSHVSMFLLAVGLLALAGHRNDRDAWQWRAGLAGGVAMWALLWGPSFLVQARGGHSDWIAPTTPWGVVAALGRLATSVPLLYPVGLAAAAFGARILRRRDPALFRMWSCCFLVPVAVAAGAGLFAPVILDRTFTVVAWAPVLAIGSLLDAVTRRRARMGFGLLVAVLAVTAGTTFLAVRAPTLPDVPLRHLAAVARPGDIVAIHPASKQAELDWSVGIRGDSRALPVAIAGLPNAAALALGDAHPGSRIWVVDWWQYSADQLRHFEPCAPAWRHGSTRILCLTQPGGRVPPVTRPSARR